MKIQREWRRPDTPPDGNYKLSIVDRQGWEVTCYLIKLDTKDEKQSASVVDTDERWEVRTVRTVLPATPLYPPANPAGKLRPRGYTCGFPLRRPRAMRFLMATSLMDLWKRGGLWQPPSESFP